MTYDHILVWSTVLLVIFLLSAANALRTWLVRRKRTRERFACWIVVGGVAAIANLVLCFGRFMPYHVPVGLTTRLLDKTWIPWQPHTAEYLLATVILFIAYRSLRRLYDEWDGLHSLEQRRRDERGERGSLISDGLSELMRMLLLKPPLRVYVPVMQQKSASPLETVDSTAAWKDEARELIRLSTTSYFFDSTTDWHDVQGCWIGRNVNTGDPVFLFPRHNLPLEDDVRSFVVYSQKITKDWS